MPSTILRRRAVERKTGLTTSTLYRFIKNGQFPAPIKLGVQAVGWLESDIEEWLSSRQRTGGTSNVS
jgi:prophage regulatory protein